ncbi:uncharacterized protein A1O9_10122 [Exophiala aquamarina CBS 119918]|uniref:Uncharacterized protein n=1 Tax=Exophiala aquamarina CBS 119918 TaxID=1182545 RepID=A0A072P1L7_9EURO|nr:uncharacterized protein A1O9_10122 [Exophiala aquamarina CBS 119918]KEF53721.1 hypothetical protein A1O9_10122 [Exophiala aquamarina CBS 119918]
MGLFDKLHSKLELYRLEQKYARRKNRTTFSTGAQYVDGEYVYSNPTDRSPTMSTNSTGESAGSSNKRQTMLWTPPSNKRW